MSFDTHLDSCWLRHHTPAGQSGLVTFYRRKRQNYRKVVTQSHWSTGDSPMIAGLPETTQDVSVNYSANGFAIRIIPIGQLRLAVEGSIPGLSVNLYIQYTSPLWFTSFLAWPFLRGFSTQLLLTQLLYLSSFNSVPLTQFL